MGNEKTYGSVEAFLKSHPQATLDLTTPMGFIHLTPEQGEELLNGGQVFAHPGVFESGHMVDADDVINQYIFELHQDEKDPNQFDALTNLLKESLVETEAVHMESMQMDLFVVERK